jgi:hypothetical protein
LRKGPGGFVLMVNARLLIEMSEALADRRGSNTSTMAWLRQRDRSEDQGRGRLLLSLPVRPRKAEIRPIENLRAGRAAGLRRAVAGY